MPVLFCFGLGYSGALLARCAESAGFRVAGTSQREHEGLEVLSFEDEEGVRRALAETSHLVTTVPPGKGSEQKRSDEEGDEDAVLARYEDALSRIPWLCYCSSLSVYGDHKGRDVDEETPPALPLSLRGEKRLRAEREWQRFAEKNGTRLCLMRIAGIYGEGRNALLRLRAREETRGEEKLVVRSEGFFNRIHVEDLVEALLCAARKRAAGIFNICDDMPSPSHEPLLYAAELLGCQSPSLVSSEQARARGLLSDTAWSFHRECKRADNGRMKRELGVCLRYPDYRRGLEELARIERL